mgnify:CR=1 FL=1
MKVGKLFLEVISTGVISDHEMVWLTINQLDFSRCEQATSLKLGRLIDSGQISLGCRILHSLVRLMAGIRAHYRQYSGNIY